MSVAIEKTLLVAVLLVLPLGAGAAEETRILRTQENVARFDPTACDGLPFATNLRLGADAYSVEVRRRDGKVTNDTREDVGVASACGQITSATFAPGTVHPFFIRFGLADGDYAALGSCTIISNDVPQPWLVLAGCNLKITSGPPGTIGGSLTSISVFNPLSLAGFFTGSFWTLHLYAEDAPARGHRGQEAEDHGR